MTLITFQDGKPVLRDGKVGTEQACCCNKQCCPLTCIITFTVNGIQYTWNLQYAADGTFYEFGQLEDEYGEPLSCFDGSSSLHTTHVQGCVVCENGKHRVGFGLVAKSGFVQGDCDHWVTNHPLFGDDRIQNIFYQKARLHVLEIDSCALCPSVTDLGVQDFEWLDDFITAGPQGAAGNTVAASACAAMRGWMTIKTECGSYCVDPLGPPEGCDPDFLVTTGPPTISAPCDPSSYEISGVSTECCEFP